ncbi:FtsX-like permease family protein [Leuconostoc gasicomitatum]|nr:FtsX-like permease family protein [Leuconostoc gasicomitatum]
MYTTICKVIDQQHDMATLQSLGYSNVILSVYYSMYGLFVGIIGAIAGILSAPLLSNFVMSFGYWFLSKYVTTFNTSQIIYYPYITHTSIILASVIVIAASLSTIVMIGKRLQQLDMISSTKGVE